MGVASPFLSFPFLSFHLRLLGSVNSHYAYNIPLDGARSGIKSWRARILFLCWEKSEWDTAILEQKKEGIILIVCRKIPKWRFVFIVISELDFSLSLSLCVCAQVTYYLPPASPFT
jgi:hypothetical protein